MAIKQMKTIRLMIIQKSLITIMVQVLTVAILETTHINNLVAGIPTPLKNMSMSVRMMTFPI